MKIWCVEVSGGTVYLVEGDLSRDDIDRIAREILVDPVLHAYSICPLDERRGSLILKKPGVMDPVEASAKKAIADLGLRAAHVRVGRRDGRANPVVDDVHDEAWSVPTLAMGRPYVFKRVEAEPESVALTADEGAAVRAHLGGRRATDIELETIAQTWSEHCKHKTLNARVGPYANLLKETIFAERREWCLSVFKDNAGVIRFDDEYGIAFKVETHNHPSAIDPYGGANTGLGGVIRDILGCGLGARPVFSTDVFCVAPGDTRTLQGVVEGVRDYGNRMGIPTVNGAVFFDEGYRHNPLVFCGTAGLIPIDMIEKAAKPGDAIVVAGGRTGRDGIHGATFSSAELTSESEVVSAGAVQIGNAIEEKKLLDAVLRIRDERLIDAITDCGAGGLSSAVGEMGEKTGAEVHLERVPLKYAGLTYTEIWISEAQERMVMAVPEKHLARVMEICREEDVEATAIGTFTGTGRLVALYDGHKVMDLEMAFLHDGAPRLAMPCRPASTPARANPPRDLLAWLRDPNIASKEWIIRQYDHEVQGGSVIKPLVGVQCDGPSDAAVVRPRLDSYRGVAVGCGFALGEPDPYRMARRSIDEAIRNVVAVGGDPRRTALLDNFCWGDPRDPEQMWMLMRACEACRDAAREFGTPFISGKDSLNNTFEGRSIPPTLLISALAIVPDARGCVTSDFKHAGNRLYIVEGYDAMHAAIGRGLVRACHDVAEGGVAVAAAEMAIGGDLGCEVPADFGDRDASFLVEAVEPVGEEVGVVTAARSVLGHSIEALREAWTCGR